MKTLYLMFDGSSPDGRGDAEYIGPTYDKNTALRHWLDCKSDPYSTGYVTIVTTDRVWEPMFEEEFLPDYC